MDYWEFLIQQEGDQTWLPLETKQVEILEGRYRIAAHTSRVNTPIEIRVSHLVLDEMPPRRRVRKRKGRTNDTGLVIIFPFMRLKPGQWEVRCNGDDVMSDLLGSGWQRVVQLQVLPKAEDDWDPDWSERPEDNTHPGSLSDSDPLISREHPVVTDQATTSVPSSDVANDSANAVHPSFPPSGLTPPSVAPIPPNTEIAIDSDYRIQLGQQAYVIPKGQPLTLSGKILRAIGTHLTASELSIQLRDPQTAKILFETRQYLATQALPAGFNVELPQLPNLKTQVILGAVTLRPKDSEGGEPALALSAFTLTAELDQLLDAIANQDTLDFEEEISIYPGTTEPFVKPAESLATLISPDLPLTPPTVRSLTPSLGLTLPPQLYEPETEVPPERTPQLPPIPSSKSAAQPEPVADSDADFLDPVTAETEGTEATAPSPQTGTTIRSVRVPARFESDSVEEDDLEAELAAAALDDDLHDLDDLSDLDDLEISAAREAPPHLAGDTEGEDLDDAALEYTALYEEAVADALSDATPQLPEPEIDPEFIHIDQSFQALNLQERFWSKLTALTYEGYRAATELKNAMQAAGVKETLQTPDISDVSPSPARPSDAPTQASSPTPATPATPPPETTPPNYEVVVYDSPVTGEDTAAAPAQQSRQPKRQPPAEISPPILEVPNHELVGGELISIRIRLEQPQDYRPYVKVWMNDLQTRTLIDEPRLLMHFTPNQLGELETLMRVKIPLGCLEIQFAAITVNMATLQESAKFVINRLVIPPDLPSLSLDEFDL